MNLSVIILLSACKTEGKAYGLSASRYKCSLLIPPLCFFSFSFKAASHVPWSGAHRTPLGNFSLFTIGRNNHLNTYL